MGAGRLAATSSPGECGSSCGGAACCKLGGNAVQQTLSTAAYGERMPIRLKRALFGLLVVFVWVILGMTFGLPYVTTLAVGLGLISPEGHPFPPEVFRWVLGVSVAVSMMSGLWWYGLPRWWIGSALEKIRVRLQTSASPMQQRAAGMLVLLHVCAFVMSPVALFWWGLTVVLTHALGWSLGLELRIVAFIVGLLWLALILGRPHRRLLHVPLLGGLVLRCQMGMVDWWMRFNDPEGAERERQRLLRQHP